MLTSRPRGYGVRRTGFTCVWSVLPRLINKSEVQVGSTVQYSRLSYITYQGGTQHCVNTPSAKGKATHVHAAYAATNSSLVFGVCIKGELGACPLVNTP